MTTETTESALDRLSRRGKLTINATDGCFEVNFKAPGPYRGRSWCTTDEADLYEHCHLGATDWQGDGPDLTSLIIECEEATRPRERDVDDLVWAIENRRDSRTYGPPLPSYMRWHGWRPGQGRRWLRTFSHQSEYLAGYLRDLKTEREFNAERREAEIRRTHRRRLHTRDVLEAT